MDASIKEMAFENFTNIRKDWEILMYLSHRNNRKIKNFVDSNTLLFHWRYLTFKDLFIEIDKAITYRSPGRGKPKILQGKIIEAITNSKLLQKNKRELINKLSKQFATIEQIRDVRDKYYAHLDKEFRGFLGGITMEKIRKLIFVIQGILVKVYGSKEINSILGKIPSWDDYDLIEKLL